MSPLTLDALAASVPDGALLALPPDNSLTPAAFARALVRGRQARSAAGRRAGLRLRHRPADRRGVCRLGADQRRQSRRGGVRAAASPAALAAGRVQVIDATCPAMHTMLQAAEKGVPFMPLRGVIGSDILAHRPDWKVIDNPFAGERRSHRAAARLAARHRGVPRGDGRRGRQCVGRQAARARHHRARRAPRAGHRGAADRPATCWRTSGWRPARSPAPMSMPSRWPSVARGRSRCSTNTASTPRTWRNTPGSRAPRTASARISTATCSRRRPGRRGMIALEERMAAAIAGLILDPAAPPVRHIAVGAASPIPAAACWLVEEGRPSGAAVAAAQAQRQPVHRGHARAVRPHRPGPHRPFLPRRRPDRRAGEHQPDRHRRVARDRRALSRQLRLGVHVPDDAAHHPVPRGALAARVRAARRHRLRPRRLAARRVPSRHGAGAGHGTLRVPFRPGARPLHARLGAPGRNRGRASAPAPASTTTSRATCP